MSEKKSSIHEDMANFGADVFSLKVMRDYLSDSAFNSLSDTVKNGKPLDVKIADEVADAMKTWAVSRGATHFTHWFQPLTGTTAEKHESFLVPDGEGGAILQFSGKELIRGEPDASSFPSGGLRATFEARGYTGWDPTSPAFIKRGPRSAILCIPTIFCGWNGEALDKKTPLLRSMEALSKQVCRLGRLFGINVEGGRAYATLGAEQEYFLIDRKLYQRRLDLMQTGRTLLGRPPPKHQQLGDHYFGAIKPRILAFMQDLDRELWRLGIPAKTRHNEVCPAQFEIAPVFEELNLAVDHNMLTMEVLRDVAERHGLVCLLHEKPFAGVNGSGKHNNWAVCGPDGKNWLTPGDNPHENAKFLTMICAIMKAVDTHADLLRASVASAANDHRLGANEAPPAIISMFLGEQLTDIIKQLEKGDLKGSKKGGLVEVSVSCLPRLPRDATDRNRTSPFAFTGNKFEFRAVGSSQSCAGPNVVLNTIVAEALDEICSELESSAGRGKNFNATLQGILSGIARKHKRIIFNGDNYSTAWMKEAAKRGLNNITSTPEALKAIIAPRSLKLFAKYGVLTEREAKSRYEVYLDAYHRSVTVESNCASYMIRTMIIPAAIRYQIQVGDAIRALKESRTKCVSGMSALAKTLQKNIEGLMSSCAMIESAVGKEDHAAMLRYMAEARRYADALESDVPADIWPLPSYAELLFLY